MNLFDPYEVAKSLGITFLPEDVIERYELTLNNGEIVVKLWLSNQDKPFFVETIHASNS
jgi:hypothetical protein